MISAFGVDHGEISKGVLRGPGGLPRSRKLVAMSTGARRGFEGAKRAGHKVATTEVSVKSVGRGTGLGTQKLGRGAGHVGGYLASNPTATGAVVVGGAGGYGAYKYQAARAKPPKTKKPRAPKPEAIQ